MPNTTDCVTLFLNATNTTVAVLSLAFIVWLQFIAPDAPVETDPTVCVGPLSQQKLDSGIEEMPLVQADRPQ